MKPSEALKIARNKISRGREVYICHALPNNAGGILVRDYIIKALDGESTYSGWLRKYHYRLYTATGYYDDRKGRLQWIDWMIKEYERIGK